MPNPIRQRRIIDGRPRLPFNVLLRDDYMVDQAAPLAGARVAVPGPGTYTITDAESKLSISGAKLFCAGGKAVPAWGDPGFVTALTYARVIGRAAVWRATPSQINQHAAMGGFATAAGLLNKHGMYFNSTGVLAAYNLGNAVVDAAYTSGTEYKFAVVLRSTGAFYYIKGGSYTAWTLLWLGLSDTTATLLSSMANFAGAFNWDGYRVLDLPSPFNAEWGTATAYYVGTMTVPTTFIHESDCFIDWTQTTRPSSGASEIRFRRQDALNFWAVLVTPAGNLNLYEVIAGVANLRNSAAGVIANGHRITILATGSTIRGYSGPSNTLRWTQSAAVNYQLATSGELSDVGVDGVITTLTIWPRRARYAAATVLDAALII